MMKRFSLILALCILPILVVAQSVNWSATYLYDAHDKTSTPVVTADVGRIESIFGISKLNLTASTFAGVKKEQPIVGTWINAEARIARNAWLRVGPAITYERERFIGRGFVVGISVAF